MMTTLFGQLENWHSVRFIRPWLGPLPITRGLILAALVMTFIAVFANVKVRYDQGQIWKANPEITEIAGAMSFSTTDAPYFLDMRRQRKDFRLMTSAQTNFPNAEATYQQRPDDAPPGKRPLLSTLFPSITLSRARRFAARATPSYCQRRIGRTDDHAGLRCRILARRHRSGHRRRPVIRLSGAIILRSDNTDQLNLGLMY